MPPEGFVPMFNRNETVDRRKYFQDKDGELRGFLRAVCTGGSGAIPLSSRQETHGRNKRTSRPIGNNWAGGSGQNWATGFALSMT
jgi:hypothetical protein